jgi:hypothetical protein
MSNNTHTTKHDHGNGTHTETTTTTYPSGASKSVTRDITDRTWFSNDDVIEVTRTDERGNSRTDK